MPRIPVADGFGNVDIHAIIEGMDHDHARVGQTWLCSCPHGGPHISPRKTPKCARSPDTTAAVSVQLQYVQDGAISVSEFKEASKKKAALARLRTLQPHSPLTRPCSLQWRHSGGSNDRKGTELWANRSSSQQK